LLFTVSASISGWQTLIMAETCSNIASPGSKF
jgi:hypothetical protein